MNDIRLCSNCEWGSLSVKKFPCSDCSGFSHWTEPSDDDRKACKIAMNSVYGLLRPRADFGNILRHLLVLEIKKVIYNDPATIVIWKSGDKTVVKCQPGDTYDPEKGLALCFMKRALGNKGNYNNIFRKWLPEKGEKE